MDYYYNEFQVPRSSPSFYNYAMAEEEYFEEEPYHTVEPFYAIKNHYLETSWDDDNFYAPPPINSLEDTFRSFMEAQIKTNERFESLFVQLIEEQRDMKNQLTQLADALMMREKEEFPSEEQSHLEEQQSAFSSNSKGSDLDDMVDDKFEAQEEISFLKSEEAPDERLFLKSEEVEEENEEENCHHVFADKIIFDKVQLTVQVFTITAIKDFPDFEEVKEEEFYEDLPRKIIKIWQPP